MNNVLRATMSLAFAAALSAGGPALAGSKDLPIMVDYASKKIKIFKCGGDVSADDREVGCGRFDGGLQKVETISIKVRPDLTIECYGGDSWTVSPDGRLIQCVLAKPVVHKLEDGKIERCGVGEYMNANGDDIMGCHRMN